MAVLNFWAVFFNGFKHYTINKDNVRPKKLKPELLFEKRMVVLILDNKFRFLSLDNATNVEFYIVSVLL